MWRSSDPRLRLPTTIIVALLVGILLGWTAKPSPQTPPSAVSLTDVLDSLEDAERRSGGVVEILDDMARGKVSSDAGALDALRDSMQELAEALGDMQSQLRVFQKSLR